ncbi:hypothetical protein OBP_162 [Pseudomonas phage OBP]|uniref:hypothetical protein n=1 Tax=Pseudomonas phage OBP TaxID=1124849 RepID=UPI000240D582|nr:hypothetical protein OBP_162 [Pseudomonas phage OBP]AEV89599.1 hypothetical protein OBP_162 [Pseudomonas phage OBP]
MELKNIADIKKKMQGDIGTLTKVISACSQADTRSGMEGYEDGGKVFTDAANHFKTQYGVSVEPTLAGMESLVTQLATGLKKIEDKETSDAILTHMLVGTESRKADLVLAQIRGTSDLHVLTSMISNRQDGIDGMEDGGTHFGHMVSTIKEHYGVEVEPTLSGLESFSSVLKSAIGSITNLMKGKNKAEKARLIKRNFAQAEEAVKQYASAEWLGKREYVEDKTVKVKTPAVFKDVKNISDLMGVVNGIQKDVDSALAKHTAVINQRLTAGLKVFNQYDNKDPGDKEITKELDGLVITPPYLKGGVDDSKLKEVKLGTSPVELPTLDEAGVKSAVSALGKLIAGIHTLWAKLETIDSKLLYEEDIYQSDFWNKMTSGKGFGQLWDAVTYDAAREVKEIGFAYDDVVLTIAQFIEGWMLASIKHN